jgi:hypothetical protein
MVVAGTGHSYALQADQDRDGISDLNDSCPRVKNQAQSDGDFTDEDADGFCIVSDLLRMIDPEMFRSAVSEQGCAEDDTGVVRCPLEETCGGEERPECSYDDDCTLQQTCEAGSCVDCACPALWAPVCGVDEHTYANSCLTDCADVEIAYAGQCQPD